jgi:uncharacterized protein with PIN domain
MNLSLEQRRRAEAIVRELQEILGSNVRNDGRAKTFDELEDECTEVGDWLTSQVLERRVATRNPADEPACCPDCQQPGCRLSDDEVRILQTSRGEAAWSEAGWFCRRCRRSFFPSVG